MYILFSLSYHGSPMLPNTILSLPKVTGLRFGPFKCTAGVVLKMFLLFDIMVNVPNI